jgi:hypothetical protein
MEAGQRDGTEAGTAAMLYAGAVTGVLLRGTTWVLSAFMIGPLLGPIDMLAGALGDRREVLFLQAAVTVAAVVAAILGGLGLQTDPARYRLPVRLLCVLFILDALAYLTPLVIVAGLGFIEVTQSGWALFGVAVVGNLGLAGLSILVLARTRRVRAASEPRPGVWPGRPQGTSAECATTP